MQAGGQAGQARQAVDRRQEPRRRSSAGKGNEALHGWRLPLLDIGLPYVWMHRRLDCDGCVGTAASCAPGARSARDACGSCPMGARLGSHCSSHLAPAGRQAGCGRATRVFVHMQLLRVHVWQHKWAAVVPWWVATPLPCLCVDASVPRLPATVPHDDPITFTFHLLAPLRQEVALQWLPTKRHHQRQCRHVVGAAERY